MSLDSVTYSTIHNTADTAPVQQTDEVPDFVAKLLQHTVVPSKEFAGLYSGCNFDGASRRLAQAEHVEFIVLDYDNDEVAPIPGQTGNNLRKTGRCIPNPVTPEAVTLQLQTSNVRAVVVSSHNHLPLHPKFRVVAFPDDAIPAHIYREIVSEFLAYSGLNAPQFLDGMDRSCYDASRFYYWPSCPPSNEVFKYAEYIDGENYELEDTVLKAPTPKPGRPSANSGPSNPGHWAKDQIRAYYKYMVPSLRQHSSTEMKAACPIHGGTNPNNFTLDTRTGFWYCFSECAVNGRRGGGIYAFHMHHRNMHLQPGEAPLDWRAAKAEVQFLIGPPIPASVEAFQQQVTVPPMTPEALQQNLNCIINSPASDQTALLTAFEAAQPHASAMIQEYKQMNEVSDNKGTPLVTTQSTSTVIGIDYEARKAKIRAQFDTVINVYTHDLDADGTYRLQLAGTGIHRNYDNIKIAPTPIWIGRTGIDITTHDQWYKVFWRTGRGETVSQWSRYEDLVNNSFKGLKNFPVDKKHGFDLAEYFNESVMKFDKEFPAENVTAHYGWQTINGRETLVLFDKDDELDDGGITTVTDHPMLESKGSRKPWVDLLSYTASLPFEHFAVLFSFLGASAGAPLVRYGSMRNPILMCAFASGSGKTTVAEFAVALWGKHSDVAIAAQSTMKGTEDKTQQFKDLPILIEEFQRQNIKGDSEAESIIYSLANGQRRTVSSKGLTAQGGEIRKGVALIASEEDFGGQYAKGADARVMMLNVKPLPHRDWSYALKRVYENNYGVLGRELEAVYNNSRAVYMVDFDVYCAQLDAMNVQLVGDDRRAIALVATGLKALERITGVIMPIQATINFILQRIVPMRFNLHETLDRNDQIFVELITTLNNGTWDAPGGSPDYCMSNDGPVAFRGNQLMDPVETKMEIVHGSSMMNKVLLANKARHSIVNTWAERGYLERQYFNITHPTRHTRKNKRGMPKIDFKFENTIVYCVTNHGMDTVMGATPTVV